jgi:hypothetical protein
LKACPLPSFQQLPNLARADTITLQNWIAAG